MKYPLDFEDTVDKSLLFWLTRFIRYKVSTLSNSNVTNKDKLSDVSNDLAKNIHSIEDLTLKVRELRKIGMNGTNVYYIPLEKFYHHFLKFGAASLKEIDEELLIEFLTSSTSDLSDATKKNYKIALITFLNYIDKQNQDDTGIMHRYDIELKKWRGLNSKSGIKLPSYIKKEEIKKFLKTLNDYKFGAKIAARNRLIIKLILYTGIRISEALKIEMKDMFKEDNIYVFQIKGKGNKHRVVMIKEDIIKSDLEDWLSRKPHTNLLFSNQKGEIISQSYIYTKIEKILTDAHINTQKKGVHTLRHTFASLLYQKSKDLILVQEALGHADINTSRIYTHFDKDKLKSTMDIF